MQVSMLEIYNETIRDLLSTNRSSSDISRPENGGTGKQYAIKHDANGNTHVSDLTIVDVRSSKEVTFLLDIAAQSRSVGKTQMNQQSSRSHLVFTLRISGVNEVIMAPSQSQPLRGRVAIVTEASRGIGRAIALHLASLDGSSANGSSIVHDLAYQAAAIAMEKQNPAPSEDHSRPTVTILGKFNPDRYSPRGRTIAKRASKSNKARQRGQKPKPKPTRNHLPARPRTTRTWTSRSRPTLGRLIRQTA